MPPSPELLRRPSKATVSDAPQLQRRSADKEKIKHEQKTLNELKDTAATLEKRWKEQKDLIQKIQGIRAKIDALRIELEQAERAVLLEKAAEIKFGKIPELEKELNSLREEWDTIPTEEKVLREEVDDQDIAKVVSRWTGIPVTRMLATESQRLANLEEELRQRVVGQEQALNILSRAVRRSRSGLGEKNKPIGSFLFLGPTGVGKTETAKALATILFSDEHAITRIDMSEYQESHAVARLIGAPPGYVGFEEGGQLTEAVRRKPYSVILLDEIEKAHPQVFNIFLQIFDEGRLTDSKGITVDFRNTILIMTSNLGSETIMDHKGTKNELDKKVWEELRHSFKPELLNRFDSVVIYNALGVKDILQIAKLQLEKVKQRLQENNISLEVSEDVEFYFAENGYDPLFGARPLKRVIEEKLVDEIAMGIIENKIKPGDVIKPKIVDEKIEI